jgi:hypothetical protein
MAGTGPFSEQQQELTEAFMKVKTSTIQKTKQILNATTPMDEQTQRSTRAELDKQIENLHLAVSTYFGDCDKRAQNIEAAISQSLDVAGFAEIGEALCVS